jgi:hypothetical protein
MAKNMGFLCFPYPSLDKNRILEFDVPTLEIKRNDNLDIKQRILVMNLEERKRLGISKSGLRYQKKKLASRGSVKLYDKVLQKIK